MFATKFASECECDGVVHSGLETPGFLLSKWLPNPKDPAVLKTLRGSALLRRSVFTTPPPPDLLRGRPFFERKNVCNSQENGVSAAIVNLTMR